MAIVTPDDLRDRFGPEIDRLADRNGDGSADAGVIEAAIADAEAEVTAVIGLTALLSGCVASGGAIDPAICASPVETLARDHARAGRRWWPDGRSERAAPAGSAQGWVRVALVK